MAQALVRDCYNCDATIEADASRCPQCNVEQFIDRRRPTRPADSAKPAPAAQLAPAIARYVSQGYRVTAQTDTTAALIKPKRFSILAFIVLLILGVIPGILYLLYFWRKKDRTVFLYVEGGRVSERKGKG